MLQETADELHARQRDMTDLMSFVIALAESNGAAIDGFQTAVGDGDSEDVAGEIVQDLFTAAGMFTVNDPVFLPQCAVSQTSDRSGCGDTSGSSDCHRSETQRHSAGSDRTGRHDLQRTACGRRRYPGGPVSGQNSGFHRTARGTPDRGGGRYRPPPT